MIRRAKGPEHPEPHFDKARSRADAHLALPHTRADSSCPAPVVAACPCCFSPWPIMLESLNLLLNHSETKKSIASRSWQMQLNVGLVLRALGSRVGNCSFVAFAGLRI